MTNTLEGKKCLASIALFRELARKNYDVYSILAVYIRFCIFEDGLQNFSVLDIKQSLFIHFGFSIPELVIKNAINRIKEITTENKKCILISPIIKDIKIEIRRKELENNNNLIIDKLILHIEKKSKKTLTKMEKESVFDSLFLFLIDNSRSVSEFTKYISTFIIENNKDKDIVKSLETIREGVLIYSAFQYTPEEYSNNTWNTELSLYFDTEILFSLSGYNGDLYYSISVELLNLIKDINNKSAKLKNKSVIELKYFPETEKEINSFFSAAKSIIEKGQMVIQKSIAMASIVNGCKDSTDLIEKRARFFAKLAYLGFKCDREDCFIEENKKFNLLGRDEYDAILNDYQKYDSDEIINNIDLLNKISILRKGHNSRFVDAKYFFVTATKLCLDLANHSKILKESFVPLTTTIEYLTEKLWIKTNRNFAKIDIKNVDVITKSQLIIVTQLDQSITTKFAETEKKYKEEKISFDEANAVLADFRQYRTQAENITENNVNDIILFTEDSIENSINNYNHTLNIVKSMSSENLILKEENERLRVYEENEIRWNRFKRKLLYVLKTTLLFLLAGSFIYLLVLLNKTRNNNFINIVLLVLSTISSFLGILRFFGIDFLKIKCFIHKKCKCQ